MDDLLVPYLQAQDLSVQAREQRRLVCEVAEPIINAILQHRFCLSLERTRGAQSLAEWDAEDVRSETLGRLIERLDALKAAPDSPPIGHFRGYVAQTTFAVFREYLASQSPGRKVEAAKICYALSSQDRFALWAYPPEPALGRTDERGGSASDRFRRVRMCGLSAWQGTKPNSVPDEKLVLLHARPESLLDSALAGEDVQRLPTGDLIYALFVWLGQPLPLNDLIQAVCALRGIRTDAPAGLDAEVREEILLGTPDRAPQVPEQVAMRHFLQHLWREICQMPAQHRIVLLLDTKSCARFISLFHALGMATLADLAEATALSAVELSRIWSDLPYEDAEIARILGLERQQVINLRYSARARLRSRMKEVPFPTMMGANILGEVVS